MPVTAGVYESGFLFSRPSLTTLSCFCFLAPIGRMERRKEKELRARYNAAELMHWGVLLTGVFLLQPFLREMQINLKSFLQRYCKTRTLGQLRPNQEGPLIERKKNKSKMPSMCFFKLHTPFLENCMSCRYLTSDARALNREYEFR